MEIKITVPTSLSEIPLKDYQQFMKVAKDKDQDDLFIRQKMVQIFCHIPLLAVTKMKRKDFNSVVATLIEVLDEKPKHKDVFKMGGVEYGMIPSLDEDMTMGEFVDLDSYMKDWQEFHKAMAVLYRPIKARKGERYRIEKYEGNEDHIEEMVNAPMDVTMGAIIFFWNLSTQLLTVTPKYLQRRLMENPKAAEVLEKNGVGISTFTDSLAEVCLRLEMLLPYTWERPYSISPMRKS